MEYIRKTARGFLNQDETLTAAYSHAVAYYPTDKGETYTLDPSIEAEFKLSDCRKTVTLEFDINSKESAKERLLKAKILYNAVKTFKERLEEAVKIYETEVEE